MGQPNAESSKEGVALDVLPARISICILPGAWSQVMNMRQEGRDIGVGSG